jgi:SAM-dependent methyltransferase
MRALKRARLLQSAFTGYEWARAAFARPRPPAVDGLPVPPPRLIMRVAGTTDPEWFLESGQLAADTISAALRRANRPLADIGALLDFGCGCGRVTRRWATLATTEVHGSDRSAEAIEWCRQNLRFAKFTTNDLEPPAVYPDARFDLIYALSVFTHLPEQLQRGWIDELKRILRPRGLLLLTVHGERYRERLTSSEQRRFDAGELVVRWPEGAGSNLCSAFHPPSYVQERLAAGLDVVDFVPEGAKGNPHQDLYLLRKAS